MGFTRSSSVYDGRPQAPVITQQQQQQNQRNIVTTSLRSMAKQIRLDRIDRGRPDSIT